MRLGGLRRALDPGELEGRPHQNQQRHTAQTKVHQLARGGVESEYLLYGVILNECVLSIKNKIIMFNNNHIETCLSSPRTHISTHSQCHNQKYISHNIIRITYHHTTCVFAEDTALKITMQQFPNITANVARMIFLVTCSPNKTCRCGPDSTCWRGYVDA